MINGCPNLIDEVDINLDNGIPASDLIADPAYFIFGAYDGAESDCVFNFAISNMGEIATALDFFLTYDIDADEFGVKNMTIAQICLLVFQLLTIEREQEMNE